MGEDSDELEELEQDEPTKPAAPRVMTARRLAAILAQVAGRHPAHAVLAARALADPDLPAPAEVTIPKRTHPSKAERRAARRKESST